MPFRIVYMLQQVEYDPLQFIAWLIRMPDLRTVMKRKKLIQTRKAKQLVYVTYFLWFITLVLGLLLIVRFFIEYMVAAVIVLALLSPLVTLTLVLLIIIVARIVFVSPREDFMIRQSEERFINHPGIKIAIAGSYGKTTLKEILSTVLSEKFNVAKTEGNMNTPIAHARFVAQLDSCEDVLLLEYGESKPGDIERFCRTTHPDYAILTGLAPNHLDSYKTIDLLAEDLLSLRKFVEHNKLFLPAESSLLQPFLNEQDNLFSAQAVDGWKISDINISNSGSTFIMTKRNNVIRAATKLLGRHQIAPLAMAASIASKLGMSNRQIEVGIRKVAPFEHRMQPLSFGGAQIIDDTYNGNLEGSLAGISLLGELKAKRKIYVTPGLVEQGGEKVAVHEKIASALVDTGPDVVVLMRNSSTMIIEKQLSKLKFRGQVKIETDPLQFYENLEHFVANGDVVMMQNDWTDNYN
ncbi:MAG: UDP-N-acetylmuramoyl-tripeptide-D-alanyl-D-alanine ligase [Patescibacteria group bacterium]|nr:UDP-N-acetylmuramoyl-tripeptide-D-alanyl-D-alanine ligase [Patescibacteria group bacterium]